MTADEWTAFFTGCLVTVGLLQAGLFIWQLILIRKSLRDAKNSAKAAKAAADATRDSVNAQITAQRPWIDINIVPHLMRPHSEPADIFNAARGFHRQGFSYTDDGAAIHFGIELKNVGLSAAFNVKTICRLRITGWMATWLESDDLLAFIEDRFKPRILLKGPTILPSSEATYSEDVALDKPEIDKLADEPAPVYHIDVITRYTYADRMGETVASFIVTHTKSESEAGLFPACEPEIPSNELRFDKIWALGYST